MMSGLWHCHGGNQVELLRILGFPMIHPNLGLGSSSYVISQLRQDFFELQQRLHRDQDSVGTWLSGQRLLECSIYGSISSRLKQGYLSILEFLHHLQGSEFIS